MLLSLELFYFYISSFFINFKTARVFRFFLVSTLAHLLCNICPMHSIYIYSSRACLILKRCGVVYGRSLCGLETRPQDWPPFGVKLRYAILYRPILIIYLFIVFPCQINIFPFLIIFRSQTLIGSKGIIE